MARSRTLRPSFFSSFTLAKVSRDCRLLFAGLWVEADDDGRLIDSPKQLAGAIFPHDDDVSPKMVRGWLDSLAEIDAIRRYEAKGGKYIVIVSFTEHQKPPHPTPSKLPPPPGFTPSSREQRENSVSEASVGQARDTPMSSEQRDALTGNAALGLGLGSGLGFCSGSGLGSGLTPSVEDAGSSDRVLRTTDGTRTKPKPSQLAQRLLDACRPNNPQSAAFDATGVIAWALKHVDTTIVEEAIRWAEDKRAGTSPLRLPRGVATTIQRKAADRGINMPDYDPNILRAFA